MARPRDIPQDVWKEAGRHADNCERRTWGDSEYIAVRVEISRAILGERERCAQVALVTSEDHACGEGEVYIADKIAAAIRKGD